MKYTLLDLTQNILSSLDADEINSINDTVEAMQVATILRSTYMDIVERANLPEHYGLVNLQSSEDSTQPVIMTVPNTVKDIIWLKYNVETTTDTSANYRTLEYLNLPAFLNRMYLLDEDETTVETFNYVDGPNSIPILYVDDTAPTYWTSLNDSTVLFDSIDLTVDTILQASKTVCFAKKIPSWEMSDFFIPDMDEPQFALLLNEAKSLAWAELRQTQHPKAEQASRRHWTKLQKSKYNATDPQYFESLPNFGRK